MLGKDGKYLGRFYAFHDGSQKRRTGTEKWCMRIEERSKKGAAAQVLVMRARDGLEARRQSVFAAFWRCTIRSCPWQVPGATSQEPASSEGGAEPISLAIIDSTQTLAGLLFEKI